MHDQFINFMKKFTRTLKFPLFTNAQSKINRSLFLQLINKNVAHGE